jgi:S1-C subfamily serine protease
MLSNDALEGGAGLFRQMFGRRGGGGGGASDLSVTPADIKVLFGADAKEHDAVLVARDTKLGLAFVKILEPEGALAAIDLGKGAEWKVGQMLVGVTRKSRGFDSAAVFERAIVTGRVDKPRPMGALAGPVTQGLPLYDAKGLPVGVAARQQGVEGADEGAGPFAGMGQSEVFLLPLDLVQRTLAQAKSRVDEAVKKAKESRDKLSGSGEKASEPAMDGQTPATPTTPETPKSPDAPKPPDSPKVPEAPKTPDTPK